MSLDIERLTPAPWEAECGEVFRTEPPFLSLQPHNSPHGHVYDDERREADLAFIALARNAFDVMMRRNWSSRGTYDNLWLVTNIDGSNLWHKDHEGWFIGTDPFSALMVADAWYRENVENQK